MQKGNAHIVRPVQRGEVQMNIPSKEAMENLWEHAFHHHLGLEQEELPILIADPLPLGQNAYSVRQWIAEVMFEKLKVKSLAIFNTAVLSILSTGRTRGLVVESGEGVTQAVPVFEGYAIPHAIFRMEVAGQDITAKVHEVMSKELGGHRSTGLPVMQAMKEKVCRVAADYDSAMHGPDTDDEEAKSFELPDSTIIKVGKQVRTGAPEVLFGMGDP